MKAQETIQEKKENIMRKIKLEKVVLSCGATGPNLEKSKRLLEMLSEKKAQVIQAGPKRRIPAFGVKPGLELGVMVTIRGKGATELLQRLLGAIENELDKSQITENTFSFGIHEYIEIPGAEYVREIGIRGLNVTVSFYRPGFRVKRKKIKSAKLPQRQLIKPEEIIKYVEENFDTEIE
ncbi:MAG: 50S ribosomal protein L5 [archaeon]